jgi:hypothetical protein
MKWLRLLVSLAIGAIVIITWSDYAASKGAHLPAMAVVAGVVVTVVMYTYLAGRAAIKRRAAARAAASGPRRRRRAPADW